MRVTQAMLSQGAVLALTRLREQVARAREAIETGHRLARPSDDPARAAAALATASALRRAAEQEEAASAAWEWLEAADQHLARLSGALQDAYEAGVTAAGPEGLEPLARENLAQSVEHLLSEALAATAGTLRGRYLFSGFRTDRPPFALDPATGTATYQGDGGEARQEVAPGVFVTVGLDGRRLLERGDFFASLRQLADAIRQGDTAAVQARTAEVAAAMDQVSSVRARLGLSQRAAEQYRFAAVDSQRDLEARLGREMGADLERMALALSDAQNAYQAVLAATARILPQSLLDYLRS